MHQTALNSARLGPSFAENARDLVDDPTRGQEDRAPAEARRDPTAGASATGVSDPTRSPRDEASRSVQPDPTAGAPATVVSDPTRGREDRAPAEARRDPTS
jgi:hypothetical protein